MNNQNENLGYNSYNMYSQVSAPNQGNLNSQNMNFGQNSHSN